MAQRPATDCLPDGTLLRRYRLLRTIGSGGFGITYLAEDADADDDFLSAGQRTLYVVKENLPESFARRNQLTGEVEPRGNMENFNWALDSFVNEATLLHQLNHPNIVRVLRAFKANGTAYFVMLFVQGESLQKYPIPRDATAATALQELLPPLLEALAYLHSKNILHRDIKPDNVLLTRYGDKAVPVLIDFGAARSTVATRTMTRIGTPGFCPPEQMADSTRACPQSDIYALGATFYTLILGENPTDSSSRLFETHSTGQDPMLPLAGRQELLHLYPASFLSAIDRALRLTIPERWASAADWLAALTPAATPVAATGSPRTTVLATDAFAPYNPAQTAKEKLTALGISEQDYNSTLLEKAEEGDTATVQLLLAAGADINTTGEDDRPALRCAAGEGHTETARILLASPGVDIDAACRADNWSKLHLAAAAGLLDWAMELLSQGANIEAVTNNGGTPLSAAAYHGHTETALALISKGAKLEAVTNYGGTPLIIAAQNGHTETALALISKGANLEAKDNHGGTPLISAAANGRTETALALISKGAKLEAVTNGGVTPLYIAAYNGHTETALALISNGAKLEAKDNYGWTPLIRAACNGHTETALTLISKGANIEAVTNDGWTPLLSAAFCGHTETALALISKGANLEAKDNDGGTPLIIAACNGHTETALALISKGANLEAKDNDGWTPLIRAACSGHTETALALISNGAKLEAVTNDGWTPLLSAACNGQTETALALISKGANIEAKGNGGWTPLLSAAENGHTETALALISKGANIEAKTDYGWTPLIVAARKGHTETVRALLEKGANPKVKDNTGKTPLDWARKRRHAEIVQLIQEHLRKKGFFG